MSIQYQGCSSFYNKETCRYNERMNQELDSEIICITSTPCNYHNALSWTRKVASTGWCLGGKLVPIGERQKPVIDLVMDNNNNNNVDEPWNYGIFAAEFNNKKPNKNIRMKKKIYTRKFKPMKLHKKYHNKKQKYGQQRHY